MSFDTNQLAARLFSAFSTNAPVDFSTVDRTGLTPEVAYEVQHSFNARKGEPVRAYKISLTSQQTQDLFRADSPLYGQIVESAVLHDGDTVDRSSFNEPLLELELEFTVLEALSADDDEAALLRKTSVAPGMELPDSRFATWFPTLPLELVISDSAVCGRVVVGPPAAQKPTVDELTEVKAEVTRDGQPLTSGVSSEVLGNPLHSLKWLVRKLAAEGTSLTPGTVVSTGTFCMPEQLTPGTYVATFDHGVGSVSVVVK